MLREYSKISLTAKLTAYMREFTDIPFAKDVARIIGARRAFEELLCGRDLLVNDLLWYAPKTAYRKEPFANDRQRVEFLFALYQKLTAPLIPVAKSSRRGTKN